MTRRRIAIIAVSWAVLASALWISDARPVVFVVGGMVAAICAAVFAMLDLADAVDEVEWTRKSRRQASTRRTDPRVSSLRRKARGTWWSESSDLGDTLVELIDDRLLANHRVDRADDPAAAAVLLTPALRSLVDAPRRTSMSPRDLHQLLADIEAL